MTANKYRPDDTRSKGATKAHATKALKKAARLTLLKNTRPGETYREALERLGTNGTLRGFTADQLFHSPDFRLGD